MSKKQTDWYLSQAAECRVLAEKDTDPRIKEFHKSEAERWLRLADLADSAWPPFPVL
jgi:hypothetical protein